MLAPRTSAKRRRSAPCPADTGWQIGEPKKGLAQKFTMMNSDRHSVGIQGLGAAEISYQSAVAYARERVQGARAGGPGRRAIAFDGTRQSGTGPVSSQNMVRAAAAPRRSSGIERVSNACAWIKNIVVNAPDSAHRTSETVILGRT